MIDNIGRSVTPRLTNEWTRETRTGFVESISQRLCLGRKGVFDCVKLPPCCFLSQRTVKQSYLEMDKRLSYKRVQYILM